MAIAREAEQGMLRIVMVIIQNSLADTHLRAALWRCEFGPYIWGPRKRVFFSLVSLKNKLR